MKIYLSVYYLLQFCGHSWIFTNMTARLLFFGKDSFADTFYTIGLVMQVCQLLSVLEILHVVLGMDQQSFLPKFIQVTERLVILFVVISSQEEMQSKCIVCVLFFLWNLWDVIRYPYHLLSAVGIDYPALTWLYHTLWIPVYPLSLLAEVYTVYESLPYFEAFGTFCYKMALPFAVSIYFPYVLKVYEVILPAVSHRGRIHSARYQAKICHTETITKSRRDMKVYAGWHSCENTDGVKFVGPSGGQRVC